MLTHSLNFFIVNKRISLAPFLLVKVAAVNSAGGSFCWNYATDLCIYGNYASDNVCCIFVGFQVLLSVTGTLVDLSVTIMQVGCYCCSYAVRRFCSTYVSDSFCSKYVGDKFYCNCAGRSLVQLCS